MKFVTRIYHCNVGESRGHICINTIKDKWNPSLTMEDVFNHVMILLYKQNPNSPMNWGASNLYKTDKNKFLEKVKEYKTKYANIDDFENLDKQNIKIFEKCNCDDCEHIYRFKG